MYTGSRAGRPGASISESLVNEMEGQGVNRDPGGGVFGYLGKSSRGRSDYSMGDFLDPVLVAA